MKPGLTNLRWIRQRKGLTQTELAKLSGVSQHSISKLETGHTVPRPDTTRILAEALGVSPRALRGGDFGDVITFTEILAAPAERRLEYFGTLEDLGDLAGFREFLEQHHAKNMERYPPGERDAPDFIGSKLEVAMMLGFVMGYEEGRADRRGGDET